MYNLRYHIASLVSVFLALSLGLVLGGLIVQKGTFSGQQEALVEGLRNEFADLRQDNKLLTAENERNSAYLSALTDDWIDTRLAGRTIYVLTNAGRNDGLAAVSDTVEAAGATTVVVTMRVPRFGLDDERLRSTVESLAADAEKPEESIAASLAVEWTSPSPKRPLTDALVEADVISIEGIEESDANGDASTLPVATGLINVAAPGGKADVAAVALQAALAELKVAALGAQSLGTKSTLASAVADQDLTAVDTLGTQIGRYSVVALLTGAEPGYYGTAQRATALFPVFAPKPKK